MKELNTIQTKLVAPKNNKNSFGGYNYRSLENILEAVKPLLRETGCTITFTDELVCLADRLFCKSTATLKNAAGEQEQSTSFAELDAHKGMSKEQSSGSSSSYARKYAVCSLLAIDDNADPDMLDNREPEQAPKAKAAPKQTKPEGLKKGQTITADMVQNGACNALIASLRIYVGKPEYKDKCAAVREYYKWDAISTYNEICSRAYNSVKTSDMDNK